MRLATALDGIAAGDGVIGIFGVTGDTEGMKLFGGSRDARDSIILGGQVGKFLPVVMGFKAVLAREAFHITVPDIIDSGR